MKSSLKKKLRIHVRKYVKKHVKKYIKKNKVKIIQKYVEKFLFLKDVLINTNMQNFKDCRFEDLQVGDIVCSWTMTYSQKYLLKDGYEELNMTKYGILLNKDKINPENSEILQYDLIQNKLVITKLYKDPGTSGTYRCQKYYF